MNGDPVVTICNQKIAELREKFEPKNRIPILFYQLIREVRIKFPGQPTTTGIRDAIERNLSPCLMGIEMELEANYHPKDPGIAIAPEDVEKYMGRSFKHDGCFGRLPDDMKR